MKILPSIVALHMAVASFSCSDPAPDPPPVLSARIENAVFQQDQTSIKFDFVITNHSSGIIRFAERRNSWGARQWSIQLTNSDGSKFNFINPQYIYYSNYLSLITLQPGNEHRSRFTLTLGHPSSIAECMDVFSTTIQGQREPTAHFSFPLRLVGTFTVLPQTGDTYPKIEFGDTVPFSPPWTGTITTPEVIVRAEKKNPDPSGK